MSDIDYALSLVAQEIDPNSNGPAKLVIGIIIILALWGQRIDRGDK